MKKKTSYILLVVLTSVLMFMLAGCSASTSEMAEVSSLSGGMTEEPTTEEPTTEEPTTEEPTTEEPTTEAPEPTTEEPTTEEPTTEEPTTEEETACTHLFGNWNDVKKASCLEEGIQERGCSKCGESESQTVTAMGHSYSSSWTTDKEASCTEQGSKSHHCTRCGAKNSETAVSALGHSYSSWYTEKMASCLEAGIMMRSCSRCGIQETQSIPMTDHVVMVNLGSDATCTREGKTEGRYCTLCGTVFVVQEVIPKAEHVYNDNGRCVYCYAEDPELIQKKEDYENYKKIVNKYIKEIRNSGKVYYKSDGEFRDELQKASNKVSKIERQLAAMQFDTSDKARAERAILEEQLAEAKKELSDLEESYSRKKQIEALEKQLDDYYNSLFEK